MEEFEKLLLERDYYNDKMGEVLNGTLHLKKEGMRIRVPISDLQKRKDLFLYKYYEYHYNRVDKLINESIYNN